METLCSCWKARWWWSIWGWSWGPRWSSATTSTSSSRAGRDPPPPLRCRRRPSAGHERLYRRASADCASLRGLFFGEIVRQTPACSHFRCIEGTNGRGLTSVCPLSRCRRPTGAHRTTKNHLVHKNRALALYRRSSFISIAVIWIDKKLRLVNSSEPNGSSCTSSVKTQYAIYSSFFLDTGNPATGSKMFCFRGVLTVVLQSYSHYLVKTLLLLKLKVFPLLSSLSACH